MVQRALSVSPNGTPHWNVVFADVPDTDYVLTAPAGGSRVWTRKSAATNTAHYYMVGETDDQSTSWVLIPAGATYTSVATWQGASYPGGSPTAIFAYANSSLGLHYSCAVATSGTAPLTQPAAGTYRIRTTGSGSTAASTTGLTGAITNFVANDGADNQCTIRIGTSSQWGTMVSGVTNNNVVWHLERQN